MVTIMKFIPVIIALAIASLMPLNAKVVKRYVSTPDATLAIAVDSIDFRKDLTRVYGRLTGTPHTSSRVDSAVMKSAGRSYTGNDIDGIDFKRYFQWEDDGCILIEIDFPAMRQFKFARLHLSTPRGESITNLPRK